MNRDGGTRRAGWGRWFGRPGRSLTRRLIWLASGWILLALVMACLGWAYDARLIRSVAMGLRTREFTETSIFSGMKMRQILFQDHLPYVLPIVFSTTMNNINWSIGLEVTLSVLGFTDINTPTVGVLVYWANQHTAMVAGIWWWIAFPIGLVILTFIGLFLLAVIRFLPRGIGSLWETKRRKGEQA
mgnify:CR=1 FL=1